MVKTSYGIPGRDTGVSDECCGVKIISMETIVQYVEKGVIITPRFQREIQEDKVMSIVEEYERLFKSNQNYFIKHGYTLSLCKLGEKKELYLIDGQHRLEAMKYLTENEYSGDVIVRIQVCKTLTDMKRDFKLLNSNSNMPIMYTDFENEFLQHTLFKVKQNLKREYIDMFNRNKNGSKTQTHRMHLDTFLELIEPEKVKHLYEASQKDIGDYKFLEKMIRRVNRLVKEKFEEFQQNQQLDYYIKSKDMKIVHGKQFYLSLDNVIWVDELFHLGDETEEYVPQIKVKPIEYKKQKIPKSLQRKVVSSHFEDESHVAPCFVCSTQINRDNVSIGHIVPEYLGGKTVEDNLRCICKSCNSSMGIENMLVFKQEYFGTKSESGEESGEEEKCESDGEDKFYDVYEIV